METNASTSKAKTQSRKIPWEKIAWQAGIAIATGVLSGAGMALGTVVVGSLAGGAAAESVATAGNVLALAKKVI